MITLGLNIYHPNSSAVLIKDGKILFAIEEERLNKIKNYTGFPSLAIKDCLEFSGIKFKHIDNVAVNFNPIFNFGSKLKNVFNNYYNIKDIKKIKKYSIKFILKKNYNFSGIIHYIDHHKAHIASSFFTSKIKEGFGLSFDGSGDLMSYGEYIFENNNIKLLRKKNFPHSLGIFYQAICQYLGFFDYGDEYKVMALGLKGKKLYLNKFKKLILYDDNDYNLNLEYFNYKHHSSNEGSPFFDNLFKNSLSKLLGKPRLSFEKITQRHCDIAKTLQFVFEDVILKRLEKISFDYNYVNLCLSGGCAHNSKLIGLIKKKNYFKNVYVQPNAGDGGGALGAALYINKPLTRNKLFNPYLGGEFSNKYIKNTILPSLKHKYPKINYNFHRNYKKLNNIVATQLSKNKIVGWFQDRMEWGPRALGNRSILANPASNKIKPIINKVIKERELFRPFASSILKDKEKLFFKDLQPDYYMTSVCDVNNIAVKKLKAVTYYRTSRKQTVTKDFNVKFYNLLKTFEKKTGIPCLLNTSLNIKSPIVYTPDDALKLFSNSKLDLLIIQNYIFYKKV